MKVMLYVAALIVLGPFILLAAYIAFRMIRSRLRVVKNLGLARVGLEIGMTSKSSALPTKAKL